MKTTYMSLKLLLSISCGILAGILSVMLLYYVLLTPPFINVLIAIIGASLIARSGKDAISCSLLGAVFFSCIFRRRISCIFIFCKNICSFFRAPINSKITHICSSRRSLRLFSVFPDNKARRILPFAKFFSVISFSRVNLSAFKSYQLYLICNHPRLYRYIYSSLSHYPGCHLRQKCRKAASGSCHTFSCRNMEYTLCCISTF